ncbi:MAG: hypothetical protein WAU10_15250 [Caldilineaceae bacterium]
MNSDVISLKGIEWHFRAFERHMRRTEKVYARFLQNGVTLNLKFEMSEKLLQSHLALGNQSAWVEFVVAMRRFLDEKDYLYYSRILDLFESDFSEVLGKDTISKFKNAVKEITHGPIRVNVNENELTGAAIYALVAEGEFFRHEVTTRARLREYTVASPSGPLFWYLFYNFQVAAYGLCAGIRWAIKRIRESDKYRMLHGLDRTIKNHCIYCLTQDGSFTSEEHIVAENLGNYDFVLPRGYVCDQCNNGVLSRLDSILAEWGPIALLRVHYVPHTKDGKLQKANFQNMRIERSTPSELNVIAKDKTGGMKITEENPDGTVRFSINSRSKWVDPKLLGRALYKIALGFYTLDHGIDNACKPEFDKARQFIQGNVEFPNNLIIFSEIVPRPVVSIHYWDVNGGTPCVVNFYGIVFLFNLESSPVIESNDEIGAFGKHEIWPLFE